VSATAATLALGSFSTSPAPLERPASIIEEGMLCFASDALKQFEPKPQDACYYVQLCTTAYMYNGASAGDMYKECT